MWTIRILDSVRFVPNLKRNLISLGALDATGYSVKISEGIMKVMKGFLVTFKVDRVNGMYFVQGFTLDLSDKASEA